MPKTTVNTSLKVKKVFEPIIAAMVTALEAKTITPDFFNNIQALCVPKSGGAGGGTSKFHRNEAGEVVAINCYYHKLWMPLSHVPWSPKANTPSGYNSMCKDGANKWSKQHRDFNKAKDGLLEEVTSGKLAPARINERIEQLKVECDKIVPHPLGIGFETLEECLAATPKSLDAMVAKAEKEAAAIAAKAEKEAANAEPKR